MDRYKKKNIEEKFPCRKKENVILLNISIIDRVISSLFFLFSNSNAGKKNFSIFPGRSGSRDSKDLYLHGNKELKYSTSPRTNCRKGVP